MWETPFTANRCMAVLKALRTWDAVPEKSITIRLGCTSLTVRPWPCSQATTSCTSDAAGPKRVPNCEAVSHWW